MTPEVSKQIANLLGQVTVSELPQDTGSLFTGEYWLYKYKETPASNVNTTAYVIQAGDFYNYLCKNVFAFLVEQKQNDIELHPGDFLDKNDTPVIMARKLLDRVPNWIGKPKEPNISNKWFKHFQYYYFDDLSKRQNTMLLKYGDAAVTTQKYDILIWLDSSSSMYDEIANLVEEMGELCRFIFAQNEENRISFLVFQSNNIENRRRCERLQFTRDLNSISTYLQHLLNDIYKSSADFFDENMWCMRDLVRIDYEIPCIDPNNVHGEWEISEHWPVGWRTIEQDGHRIPDPSVKRVLIAISDESIDPYVSITGQFVTPYKKDHLDQIQDDFSQLDNPDKTVWRYRDKSPTWDISKTEEADPDAAVKVGVNNSGAFRNYNFFKYARLHEDADLNATYYPNNPEASFPVDPSDPSLRISRVNPPLNINTVNNWANSFIENDVLFFWIDTRDNTDSPDIDRYVDWEKRYVYKIQEDLISKIKTADGQQMGFFYAIQPYEVTDTLGDIFKNVLVAHDPKRYWANDMWETHLSLPVELQTQELPYVFTKDYKWKQLGLVPTSIVEKEHTHLNKEFKKRNYIKIVMGGWDKGNLHDTRWADPDEGLNDDTLGPEINDDLVVNGVTLQENMGDIDQTFVSIGEFLDDAIESIEPMNHKGKVIFTASKELRPVNGAWSNVLGNDNECFVWSGGSSLTGENLAKMSNLPKHHHNTVLNEDTPLSIQNVSIVGRPEGETVGGIVKVPTAERMPETDNGKAEDTAQDMISTGAVLDESPGGAYCGTVVYSPYEVHAAQQGHNNMPLYYKMRAFVHG